MIENAPTPPAGQLPPPAAPTARRALVAAWLCLWAGALAAGLTALWRHQQTPGMPAAPPTAPSAPSWTEAGLPQSNGRPILLLLAHPHCPCTRASLHELEEVLARRPGRAATFVLFVRPAGCPPGWEQTDLWREAAAIPGVTPVCDEDGRRAAALGAYTSGQALLFGADGRLRFAGGLTASRGHEGDNDGADALGALLDSDSDPPAAGAPAAAAPVRTPVFGCALR